MVFQNAFNELDYGSLKTQKSIRYVDRELAFTRVHQEYREAHPCIREIMCLREQAKLIFQPIEEGRMFAGFTDRMEAGIDPERGNITDAAYFCHFDTLEELKGREDSSAELQKQCEELIAYWQTETTHFKCRSAFTEDIGKECPEDNYYSAVQISYPMYGFGGPCLNYDKLLTLGITGLRKLIKEEEKKAAEEEERVFLSSLQASLDILCEVISRYQKEAEEKKETAGSMEARENFKRIFHSLTAILAGPPKHYHEAIQLFWLYSLLSLTRNYGRMDIYLGDFLKNDLESGYLTEEEAKEITCGLWHQIILRTDNFNNRIIIGGKGRRNEEAADLFAEYALDAQIAIHDTIPQLSLRCYEGMKASLWEKAFDALKAGSTFPILYNDEVNIPGVKEALKVTEEEAMQYTMYGCGEIVIDHKGIGSPDGALNLMKVLEVTLNNGIDTYSGKEMGLKTGSLMTYETFEDLYEAFCEQAKYQINLLAKVQDTIYRVTGEDAAFPFISLLYDDCIKKRKSVLKGGADYLGGTLESFGNNSAADALYAIKRQVYDLKKIGKEELLAVLKRNYQGFEEIRSRLLEVDKYGNDKEGADAMSEMVNHMVCRLTQEAAAESLHSYNAVLVNNGDSVMFGKGTGASADGRLAGQPLSNGNQPGAGNDKNGLTSLLNSMAKLSASLHAGATHNVKLTKSMLKEQRKACQALIKGYFKNGGTQVMLTITDKEELLDAMVHPEKYRNLIVRVGGYSERFVELPEEIQKEVLARTFYE